jgi:multidrug efflux pump subunit AcrB
MMSAESPQPAENSAWTQQQVEEAYRETEALSRALARARSIRRTLGLLTLLLIVAIIGVFYYLGSQFMQKEFTDQLLNTAQERLQKNSSQYMHEVQLLYEGVSPAVNDAFMEQFKKDMPKFVDRMDQERETLAKTLTTKLEQKLEDHYQKLLEKQDKTLREEFPTINDSDLHEKMIKNIDLAMQKLIKKYYADEMETQFKQIFASWDQFPPAPAPRPGDPSIEDQFIAELLEMLKFRLSHFTESAQR